MRHTVISPIRYEELLYDGILHPEPPPRDDDDDAAANDDSGDDDAERTRRINALLRPLVEVGGGVE